MGFAAEDLVERGTELRVAVVDRESHMFELSRVGEVARLLHDPATARMGSTAREMDTSTLELDEEEHVVATQERRFDREEVACEHARGLLAQELAPGGPRTPWRRQKAGSGEYPTNGARRD
jgi:hypothetical protein